MTREDEIKNIALCYAHDELKDNHSVVEDVVVAAFMDGANYADAHPHWISVEDEMPPKDKAYLAYWQHLGRTKYRYIKAGAKVSSYFSAHITHWMHLPSPPKKGGEE